MPEEIFKLAVISIVFGSGVIISVAGMVAGLVRQRMKRRDQSGASLTGTELRALIHEAVTEATEPLRERVDGLERNLAGIKRQLPDASSRTPLVISTEDDYGPVEETAARRRSRA